MMKPITIVCVFVSILGFVPSCGEDLGGLYGAQCDLMDCSYDVVECQLYSNTEHAIVVHYIKDPNGQREWTARIAISLEGIDKVSGLQLEGQDFLDRVTLTRPSSTQQWPEYDGTSCKIRSGGDQAGGNLSGKCSFSFLKGHYLSADFSCLLEAAD